MKNKFILITLIFFIIFSFLLSSFSFAIDYDDNGNTVTFPDFEFPEGTTDYVIFNYGSNREYYMFGFSSKETASKCYLYFNSSGSVSFIIPRTQTYWCAKYDAAFPDFGWRGSSGKEDFKWLTAQNAYSGDSHTVGHTAGNYHSVYSTFDIKDGNGNVVFDKVKNKAFIENKEQIQTGKFDKVVVNAADYTNKELYLLTYWFTENTDNPFETMLPRKIILLKTLNNFYVGTKNEKAIYEVPFGHTGIDLVER